VGIDIINTLSKSYGVTVPLFVDNAESVTRIETSDTQIIRLVVSENDKELRVSYEN
jgi:CRISPR/Cas system type I-B associated protein Csh2 (Cas7 group RAMP superfamily)